MAMRELVICSITYSTIGMRPMKLLRGSKLHWVICRIREMDHVYEGYKNIIQRILEPPKIDNSRTLSANSESQWSRGKGRQGPAIATSAISRFERLGDRLQLLILSETKEFMAEKDALTNTYFNINAQKDSEATASLTRAAGLLAKLSVLFLPVSLMTSTEDLNLPTSRPN
ncbi:hypothetical protein M7I_5339 [Glarea lozoyensis 74030]|uniref:Uncharacterized protein n=1 Tax=Glarea lozoyensis (strain ATCC 74030 / MF5533) TaxID=1104152 RepID=H0ERL9_GLAL7|nr:hypothetical protein M7I_5339 [Glarea lozoyensis 74030]